MCLTLPSPGEPVKPTGRVVALGAHSPVDSVTSAWCTNTGVVMLVKIHFTSE